MIQTTSANMKRDLLFLSFAVACLMVALPGRASAQTSNIVSCNSDDMHLHTCTAGPNGGIRLVRQHSDSPCERGRSYGVRGTQIWVDHGCRADFEVLSGNNRNGRGPYARGPQGRDHDYRDRDHDRDDRDHHDDHDRDVAYRNNDHDHDRGPGMSGPTRIVMCASDDMGWHACNIGASRGVRVLRQMSQSPCQLGRSFGVRGGQLWVDHGCRAQFEVLGR